jgi:excisionase family DNA binding protein
MTAVSHSAAAEVRLYDVNEAMAILRLSRSVIYEEIRSRRLRSAKRGRSRRISAAAIADYIALLEQEAEDGNG